MKTFADLKVGDTIYVWVRDVYSARGLRGTERARAHWREEKIIGETRVSWLYGSKYNPNKLPKKGPKNGSRHIVLSLEEVNQLVWLSVHGYAVGKHVSYTASRCGFDVIKKIAEISGYDEAARERELY